MSERLKKQDDLIGKCGKNILVNQRKDMLH